MASSSLHFLTVLTEDDGVSGFKFERKPEEYTVDSSRHIRVLGQFQINKKYALNQRIKIQQTFPSFPHNLHFFPTAKPNATYIFVLILANDELFEFCVSCGEFGGNMKVFVEFVLRLIFVDLKLSQNPYMPTTYAQFSVREILKFATSF